LKVLDHWLKIIEESPTLDRLWSEMREYYGYEGIRVFEVSRGRAELIFAQGGRSEPVRDLTIAAQPWGAIVGPATVAGKIVEVRDYPNHPEALPDRKQFIKSLFILPLRFEGEGLGAVVMTTHEFQHSGLSNAHLQELRILQSLLSARMALRSTRRLLRRQRGLVAFMDDIHKINRVDDLVPVLFKNLSRDIEFNAAGITFIEGASLRILYGIGDVGTVPNIVGEAIVPYEKDTLTYRIVDSGEPLLVGDMFDPMSRQIHPARSISLEPESEMPDLRSFLGAPFGTHNTTGVISLQSERPWRYGLDDLEHLVAVAEVIGYAVENLRWRGLDRFARRLGQLQWRSGGEREFLTQLLLAISEVWHQYGAAFYLQEAVDRPFELITATGSTSWLPAHLSISNLLPDQPLLFSSFHQVPEDFRSLWNQQETRGAILLPFDDGFIWLTSIRGFTDWDLQLARSMMREIRPYAARLGLHTQLAREAALDPLTGVLNRRQLDLQLSRLSSLAARHGYTFSVAVVDMANFSRVNNEYGHLVGDRVLARVAELLRQSLREEDEVYRLGGDEFVIVLPHSEREEGLYAARRAADVIAGDAELRRHGVYANFGLAVYREGDTPESLLERADREMYAAKKRGLAVLEQPLGD